MPLLFIYIFAITLKRDIAAMRASHTCREILLRLLMPRCHAARRHMPADDWYHAATILRQAARHGHLSLSPPILHTLMPTSIIITPYAVPPDISSRPHHYLRHAERGERRFRRCRYEHIIMSAA